MELALLSPLTPVEIVDGLAIHTLRKSAWTAGVLAAIALVSGLAGGDTTLLWLAGALPLLLLTAAFGTIYLCMAGPGLGTLLCLALLWAAPCCDRGWPLAVSSAFLVAGWSARRNAVRTLATHRPVKVDHLQSKSPGKVKLWSENPVIVRELRRQGRRAGVGPLALLLHRHGSFMFICLLTSLNILTTSERRFYICQIDAYLLVLSLAVLQTLRTALTVTPAVVQEREGDTMTALALCGLTAREFLDGWARWSWRDRMLESGIGIALALGLATWGIDITPWHSDDCTPYPLPMYTGYLPMLNSLVPLALDVVIYTWAAGYLGLAASAGARTQSGATSSALALLILLGCAALFMHLAFGPWHCVALGFLAGSALRGMALRSLIMGAR